MAASAPHTNDEQLRQQAEQRIRVLEIAQLTLSGRSPDDVFRRIGQSLFELLHYDEFGIFWLDEEAQLLRSSWLEIDAWSVTKPNGFTLPLGEGLCGEAALTGKPLLVNNAHLDPRSRYPANFQPEIDHLMVLPLYNEEKVIGTLSLNRYNTQPFSQADFETVQIYATLLSQALVNVHLLSQARLSEERYRRLFEESIDVIYISTPAGQTLDINQAGVDLLGYESREELLQQDVTLDFYIDPAERSMFQQLIAQQGLVVGLESRRRRKDGQIIHVEENATAIRDAQGDIVAYQGFLRDITARKMAEQMLHQVVDGARCLIWTALVEEWPERRPDALNWKIFKCFNEDAASQFFPVSQQPEQSYLDAWGTSRVAEDMLAADRLSVHAMRSGLPGYRQEFRYRQANGELHWMAEEAQITRVGYGRWQLVGICTDITDRHRQEEELRQTSIALQHQIAELKRREYEITLINQMSLQLQACYTHREACELAATTLRSMTTATNGLICLRDQYGLLHREAAWGEPIPVPSMQLYQYCQILQQEVAIHAQTECKFCTFVQHCIYANSTILPIRREHELEGLVILQPPQELSQQSTSLYRIEMVIRPLELAIANLHLRESLQNQAIRDPLTGLFNRRYMEESLARELHRATRRTTPLGLMMIDLDYFKQVNDRYGHAAGDLVLQTIGQFLIAHIRAEDIACRYGGEEFMLILPESALDDTTRRAEQICEQVRDLIFEYQTNFLPTVTVSIGIAAYPQHGTTNDELMYAADMALYRAKTNGRNRVELAISKSL